MGPWLGSFEHPYCHINDAVRSASDGDRILVAAGVYYEHLVIDKKLHISGEDSTTTIIDGMNIGTVCTILVSGVILEQITLRCSGGYFDDAGLQVASFTTLKNCSVYRARVGVLVVNASVVTIDNCTFHTTGFGIKFITSTESTLSGCTFAHNAIGITIQDTSKITLSHSYLHTNGRALYIHNAQMISIDHCNISDNSVNHGGIFIEQSRLITINDSIICHNGAGVSIESSQNVDISFCRLSLNTHFGIWIHQNSIKINIHYCMITDNYRFGIYVVDQCSFQVIHNTIIRNGLYGFYSKNSQGIISTNYWGSLLGPSISPGGKGNAVYYFPSRMHAFPWHLRKQSGYGASWTDTPSYLLKPVRDPLVPTITSSDADSDADGASDQWEQRYGYDPLVWDDHLHLDTDGDALTNVEECYMDANPFRKDIFVEIDYMKSSNPISSNKPSDDMIAAAVAMFSARNITLHVDVGLLGGGEEIPLNTTFSFVELVDLYWDYFLHNDMNNPRKQIFHYGLICDRGPDVNFPFVGWNHLDAFLISAQQLAEQLPQVPKERIIIGGMIHHLGHTMNLLADTFDGIDNILTLQPFSVEWLKYRNYKSCMNYYYKYTLLDYSDGSRGRNDFNDWNSLQYDFFKNSKFPWPLLKEDT
ncbi:MAG: right-handed parallel beta-helix repeat-containing protein [Candidatus Thermoplasmatota archaeon]